MDADLKAYGFAPGDYHIKCHACGEERPGCDKRARTCERCAKLASEFVNLASAQENATLRAENARLAAALRPFARIYAALLSAQDRDRDLSIGSVFIHADTSGTSARLGAVTESDFAQAHAALFGAPAGVVVVERAALESLARAIEQLPLVAKAAPLTFLKSGLNNFCEHIGGRVRTLLGEGVRG